MMNRTIISVLCAIASMFAMAQQQQIYVSSTLKTNGNGSKESPYASIQEALNHACNTKTDEVTIHILPGNYYITKTLVINKTNGHQVTISGSGYDKTRIIGGVKLQNWKPYKNGIYRAPFNQSNGNSFEQLYVNGKFAQMARTPNSGYATVKSIDGMTMTFDKSSLSDLSRLTNEEIQNVRFEFLEKWDVMKWIPGSVNVNKGIVNFKAGSMKPWNKIATGTRCVILNSPKSLDEPGEWYYDKELGYVYYYPFEGEDMSKAEVIIPLSTQLLKIEGTANDPTKNILIDNISFECSTHITPSTGEGPEQASAHIGGAIKMDYADNIKFDNCKVSLTGGYGIEIGKQCHNDTISHCLLNELGAGGVKIGLMTYNKGEHVTSNIVVDNNIIRSLGRNMANGVGILVLNASDNKITHNDISNLYYSGISVGWTWGFNEKGKYNPAVNNTIAYNKVHKVGQGVLSDLAGIYTLGVSPGTTVSNNVIYNVKCSDYGGFGIYADEGSSDMTISNNLVYNCSSATFVQNYGRNNIITNNIFAYGGEYQLHLVKTNEQPSFTFSNNIVLYKTGRTLSGSLAWIERGKFTMNHNIYWHQNGKLDLADMDLNNWKKYQDRQSIEANPMFLNPEDGDFHFQSQSSAKRIGFKPFDYTQAGVYGSKQWTKHSVK